MATESSIVNMYYSIFNSSYLVEELGYFWNFAISKNISATIYISCYIQRYTHVSEKEIAMSVSWELYFYKLVLSNVAFLN